MKFTFILLISLLLAGIIYAQGLDKSLETVTNNVALKLSKKTKARLAVTDFVNNAGKSDAFTQYVTDQVETYLINSDYSLHVMDRKHIKLLLSEHHLQSEGLIDESTAKSAVSFIPVDGWVTGEITSFGEQIKVSLKVINITTSEILAAYSTDMISDPAITKLKESSEEQNASLDKNCAEKHTGDFCFTNQTDRKVYVRLDPNGREGISLDIGQTQCFYNFPVQAYTYKVWKEAIGDPRKQGMTIDRYWNYGYSPDLQGQVKIEQCRSHKFILK